jgi:hypothetical protein
MKDMGIRGAHAESASLSQADTRSRGDVLDADMNGGQTPPSSWMQPR